MLTEIFFYHHVIISYQIVIDSGFVLKINIKGSHRGPGKPAYIGYRSVIKPVLIKKGFGGIANSYHFFKPHLGFGFIYSLDKGHILQKNVFHIHTPQLIYLNPRGVVIPIIYGLA
jgi:hypothetical protein